MKKILWVDDDALSVKKSASKVEDIYDIRFEISSTLSDALYRLEYNHYDVLIVDVSLPLNYSSSKIVFDNDFYQRFNDYPGISLIYILFNESKYNIKINSLTKIVICSSYDFNLLQMKYDFLQNPIIFYFSKAWVLNISNFAQFLFDTPIEKVSNVAKIPIRLEEQYKEKIIQVEKIIHDFKNYYIGLYDVITSSSKLIDIQNFNIMNDLKIEEIDNVDLLFSLLVNKLNKFYLKCIDNNPTESQTLKLAEYNNEVQKILSRIEKGEEFATTEIKAILYSLKNAFATIKTERFNYPNVDYKLISRITNLLELHLISGDLNAAGNIIIKQLIDSADSEWYKSLSLPQDNKCDIIETLEISLNEVGVIAKTHNVILKPLEKHTKNKFALIPKDILRLSIRQVLINAVKYCDRPVEVDPWVTVRVKETNDKKFLIQVESWGPGITELEIKDRLIFNRGYRGSKLSMGGRGFGFGLHETETLLKQYNCSIEVESRLEVSGKFTNTFLIFINK